MSLTRGRGKNGKFRSPRTEGSGAEPVISGRVPAPVIALLLAKATELKLTKSAIVREALCRYVEGERAA
jgi:hypothetical protein